MVPENDAEAFREYMEVYKKYNEMVDKYFPVMPDVPGKETKEGKPFNLQEIHELDRLAAEAEEKRKIWIEFFPMR